MTYEVCMRLYAKYEDWKDSSWFTVPLPSFRMVSVEGSQACAVLLKTKDVKFLAKVEKSVSNICNLNTIGLRLSIANAKSQLLKTKWPLVVPCMSSKINENTMYTSMPKCKINEFLKLTQKTLVGK